MGWGAAFLVRVIFMQLLCLARDESEIHWSVVPRILYR